MRRDHRPHRLGVQLGTETREAFDLSIAVDLRAPFLVTQAAAGRLRDGVRVTSVMRSLRLSGRPLEVSGQQLDAGLRCRPGSPPGRP